MFWQDVAVASGRRNVARVMPPIPETGWRPPTYFPNLAAAKVLSIDVEVKDTELNDFGPGWARGKSSICGIAVGTDDGARWYFPMRHEVEPEYNLDPDHVLAWARDNLTRPYQPKTGANLIYDVGTLRAEGVYVQGELVDVQFAEALLDEQSEVNLDELGLKYLGIGKAKNLLYDWCHRYYGGSEKDQRMNIYRAPPRLVGPYAEGDVDLPMRVVKKQYPLLASQGLVDLFRVECELIPLLVDMRFAGVSVNVARAAQLQQQLIREALEQKAKLRHMVGFDVDVNSSDSLARMFDKLGLSYGMTAPSKNFPKGRPSFTKDFLKVQKHPAAAVINEIRKLDKLRITFLESYILNSHVNGKVHCSFHPLRADDNGTRSGRLSSSDPNLQNIPIRDDIWGPLIRSLFIPDSGHPYWRKYDYSQIEYRMLVHFAVGPGSDEARYRYISDPSTDYHEWALEMVAPQAGWDISTPEGHKKWRRPIKNLNFGLIFGQGEEHTAEVLFMNLAEARKLFAAYHKGVPFAKPTMKATMREAELLGFITTVLGRRSRFDLWESADYGTPSTPLPYEQAIRHYGRIKRAKTYRALNRRLQGSAADLLKVAMWKCYKAGIFAATGVPRLTVHDELDFSDPGTCNEAFREMKHVMETAIPLRIPVIAECDRGDDWGNATAFTEAA